MYKVVIKTLQGLEDILIEELKEFEVSHIEKQNRAVICRATKEALYSMNLNLRTALQLLVPIHKFGLNNEEDLYIGMQQVNWSEEFKLSKTFSIDVLLHTDLFNHSRYVALKCKDAIADQFVDKLGKRPNVDPKNPDFPIHIYIKEKTATVFLKSSGQSLHRRGYRKSGGMAPLNEVLAAGMLLMAGYKGDQPLMDPMCGSGTLLAEAALIASKTAPGLKRDQWGFMSWKDYDSKIWNTLLNRAKEKVTTPSSPILGKDISARALEVCADNLMETGLHTHIKLKKEDFTQGDPPDWEEGLLICNPPYDQRIEKTNIINFYKAIGDQLKKKYQGWQAWIISSNIKALKSVGLRPSAKRHLFNGPLECRYFKFEMYAGSKKAKKN